MDLYLIRSLIPRVCVRAHFCILLILSTTMSARADGLPELEGYRESIQQLDPMDTSGLDPKLAQILNSYYIQNFDSPDNWEKVQSIRYDGWLHLSEGSVRFIAFKKKPDYCKVVLFAPGGGRIVMAYDGTDAWQFNTTQPDAEPEAMPPAEARNFIRDATTGGHLLYPLIEGKTIRLLGTTRVDNMHCYELEITLPDGQRIRSALEMGTKAERRQITVNAANGLEEINLYHEFSFVDDIRFALKSTMESGGEQVHGVEMLRIQLNLGIMPWMFQRPSGAYVPGGAYPPHGPDTSQTEDANTDRFLPEGSSSAFGSDRIRFEEIEAEEMKSILDEIGKPLPPR